MVRNHLDAVLNDVQTLFASGTIGALTDSELLARFLSCRDESAEAAFAALIQRHGPMVLRVCHSILRDSHDAQDAFQATFLVFVRRAATVRKRESVGSWLYGVAVRVATRAAPREPVDGNMRITRARWLRTARSMIWIRFSSQRFFTRS